MIHTDYIRTVLERVEGKGIHKGYVPCDKATGKPLGVSGVTIGTGLDLGQQTRASLEAMALPVPLVELLTPYLGAKREDAVYLLARQPLTLTAQAVAALDAAVHAKYIAEAATIFGEGFARAPKEVQAVAVSLHFQFGMPYRKTSPALARAWVQMQEGQYAEAAQTLRDPEGWSESHRRYLKRRGYEAGLLESAA